MAYTTVIAELRRDLNFLDYAIARHATIGTHAEHMHAKVAGREALDLIDALDSQLDSLRVRLAADLEGRKP